MYTIMLLVSPRPSGLPAIRTQSLPCIPRLPLQQESFITDEVLQQESSSNTNGTNQNTSRTINPSTRTHERSYARARCTRRGARIPTRSPISSTTTNQDEVRASQPGRIARMDHNPLVPEEVRAAGDRAQKLIRVANRPSTRRDVAMLASQVACLARLRGLDLARVQLATVGGVQVRHRGGTVAVGGYGELVDVVGDGAVCRDGGDAGEVHGEHHARAARGGDGLDSTGDDAAGVGVEHRCGEGGEVGCGREVGLDGRVHAAGSSVSNDWRTIIDERTFDRGNTGGGGGIGWDGWVGEALGLGAGKSKTAEGGDEGLGVHLVVIC